MASTWASQVIEDVVYAALEGSMFQMLSNLYHMDFGKETPRTSAVTLATSMVKNIMNSPISKVTQNDEYTFIDIPRLNTFLYVKHETLDVVVESFYATDEYAHTKRMVKRYLKI